QGPALPKIVMREESELNQGGDKGSREKAGEFIVNMQQCLKGTRKQPVVNYNEAVAQARAALECYPEHPDVLVQAAVCYKTRAAREKDLPLELRVQDMERAVELMDHFIRLSLQPAFKNHAGFQARRAAVNAQCNAMRKTLAQANEKLDNR